MLWNGIFTFLTFSVKAKIFFGFLCVNKWKSFSRVRLFAAPWAVESMEFCRPEYWSGEHFSSPGDLPNPRIKPSSPTLQADSSPAEPQGEPKNTEVGSLSLLQQILPTQELNRGLLHCSWILHQLSYQGSPYFGSLIQRSEYVQWNEHSLWIIMLTIFISLTFISYKYQRI